MQHKLKTYKDSGLAVTYCELCSKEGQELFEPCIPIASCPKCGHYKCKCEEIKNNFKKAIDKYNSRN